MTDSAITRRNLIRRAGRLAGALSVGIGASSTLAGQTAPAAKDVTGALARYMAAARTQKLPPAVLREAKHRILDTLGAMVSGARLKPGEMALRYVKAQGGAPEASVIGATFKTTAVNAALANGMSGHADETDDFEPITKAHPGCSAVAAALAMAEREGRSGIELITAVTLGYDLCCRFLMALGADLVRATHRSAEGVSSTFGSAAAAASLARLDETGMRYVLSYAGQQVSGIWSWERDAEHVEKAFDFGGMGARNGVTAAIFVQSGFTGVRDALDGEHNILQALSTEPKPQEMLSGLGQRFFVTETAIKTFSVGYPIQAPLDAFLQLRRQYSLNPENVERITIKLPADGAGVVDNRSMPDINCQHILALALVDGGVSFSASHSYERMTDPRVLAAKQRVELVADRTMSDPSAPRSGLVEVKLKDGRVVSHLTKHPPGTKENPLDTAGVNAKVRDLMNPVLGPKNTEALIRIVNELETLDDIRKLRPLLAV